MADVLYLLLIAAFFALAAAFVKACEAIIGPDELASPARGDRIFLPVERAIYRICRVDPDREQRWPIYAYSLLAFSFVSVLVLYAQLRLQGHLPLNPDHRSGVPAGLSFNTATSFLTNT